MIQRIQTIYLLLIFILSVLFLSGEIMSFENGTYFTISGIHSVDSSVIQQYWPFTILMLIVPVLCLVIIFLYGNRKFQMLLTSFLIFGIVLLIIAGIYYTFFTIKTGTGLVFGVKLILPILMLIFSILAYRGIRKDEAIVRSYDRLR
ncbi:MAG TPA: DUF4293 domain-containing protein [Bacteroidales bacterium]|nr:DUF4293 domain-containing protein [Bacteroidales bacterium]